MPTFNPSNWNDASTGGAVQHTNNCYDYAVDKKSGRTRKPSGSRPGKKADQDAGTTNKELKAPPYTCAQIEAAVVHDGFNLSTKAATCPTRCWKVAVMRAVLPGGRTDFHFVRQDANGTWSHKQGAGPATQNDSSNNPITDPSTADIRAGAARYAVCNYYCVCPSTTVAMVIPGGAGQFLASLDLREWATLKTEGVDLNLAPGRYTLFKQMAEAPTSAVFVSLQAFSGETNPSWRLSDADIAELGAEIGELGSARGEPELASGTQGFLLTGEGDVDFPAVVQVVAGHVSVWRGKGEAEWFRDPRGRINRWLIGKAKAQGLGELVAATQEPTGAKKTSKTRSRKKTR